MKKYRSMVSKILMMIVTTGILVGGVIIFAGAVLIYNAEESGIESEIVIAGGTLGNIYAAEYGSTISFDGEVCRAGNNVITEDNFNRVIGCINCEEDIDFTVFFEDMRVFTTVHNIDGSFAVGTKAADDVKTKVLEGGEIYLSQKVMVNGVYYMGYYQPIVSEDGVVTGMLFAGKPLKSAKVNAVAAVMQFVVLGVLTLFVSLAVCFALARDMLSDVSEIKKHLAKLAEGDFSAEMPEHVKNREDELGEISMHIVKVHDNLRDMVERDPLTSLLNRRSCIKRLDAIPDGSLYTIVMADIDYFKKINDTYGHAAGDVVLKGVSEVLNRYSNQSRGYTARWGGEEFLMVFPDKDEKQTEKIVSDMLDEIRAKVFSFEQHDNITVTMTCGIASSRQGINAESVINRADKLLYDGKMSGRNRIVL
ncbi:MAG: diguanylate cyclase [Oscillospiraceae bacterium]